MLHSLRENLHRAFTAKNKLGSYKFSIFRPSGNDTGLIAGVIQNAQQRKSIADALQEIYPTIEQVGFINPDSKHAELMMTGGEFCGNAARSAAYYILNGKPGKISVKVSGVAKKLLAGVTEEGEGFCQIPIYSNPSYIKTDPDRPGNVFVIMEGITHYLDFDVKQIRGLTVEEIKVKARREMSKKHLDHNPACGIIYVKPVKDGWSIHPIIYVRDADTLYYETACGSGTAALGLVLAQRGGKTIREISVLQPSGLSIKVSVVFDGIIFGYTQIQSSIEKLYEGMFKLRSTHANNLLHNDFSTSRKILRSFIKN